MIPSDLDEDFSRPGLAKRGEYGTRTKGGRRGFTSLKGFEGTSHTDSGKEMRDFRSRISDCKFFSRNDLKSEIIDLEYELNSWTPYHTIRK